jgi:PEP-CTERM motif-containing protein
MVEMETILMKHSPLAVFGLLTVLSASPAAALPILNPTVTDLGGGMFGYSYELINPADSTENVFDLGLIFEGIADDVVAPTGWDVITGLGFINWFSTDPVSDLLAGSSLGGFSFASPVGPGGVVFATLGVDSSTGEVGLPAFGLTDGPSLTPVPEPGSLWLLGVGLSTLVARRLRSKVEARKGRKES